VPPDIANDLSKEFLASAGTGLIFIIGLWRNWWVMGRQYDDVAKDRDRWRDRYLRLVNHTGQEIVDDKS
jgi:hypothetical protein